MDFKTLTFLFLNSEVAELTELVAQVEPVLKDRNAYLFELKHYEEFVLALFKIKDKLKIKNSAIAIMAILRAGRDALLAGANEVESGNETAESPQADKPRAGRGQKHSKGAPHQTQ
jgi:hypothetical protein